MTTLIYDLETTGLSPWEHQIICIGIYDIEKGRSTVIWEDSEEETVQKFINYCSKRDFDEVVGYNVSFDDRFIFAKCLKYEIGADGFFEDAYHKDLMSRMKTPVKMYSSNSPGGLDDWTEYLFSDGKEEDNGSVPELYERGEYERIKNYCVADLERTYKLWRRTEKVLGKK